MSVCGFDLLTFGKLYDQFQTLVENYT